VCTCWRDQMMEAVHLKNTSSYLKALQYTKDFGFDPRLTIPTRGFSMSYRQAFQKAAFDHHPHSRKPCGSIAATRDVLRL
jgi:hypothetical protein